MNFFNVFLSFWPIYRPVWVVANSMLGVGKKWQYDSMYIDFYAIYRFLIKYKYTPGLTSIVFKQSSKYIKTWYFSHKNRGSSVEKNGASGGFNSQLCCWHSWDVSKSLSIIRQNLAVAVELAGIGKLDN